MGNKFKKLASIINRNIICTEDITKERSSELITLCKQNNIQIKLKTIESSNCYTFSWKGWLNENKGFVESALDCPFTPPSDDDYYVSWNLFRSMASGTYIIKTEQQYKKIIEGRERIRRKKEDERDKEKMIMHSRWLSRQENVNLSCIM